MSNRGWSNLSLTSGDTFECIVGRATLGLSFLGLSGVTTERTHACRVTRCNSLAPRGDFDREIRRVFW